MIPAHALRAVNEALKILPSRMDSPEARVAMYTIGLQESRLTHRRQIIEKNGVLLPVGPAKGLWQFEKGGGCKGVVEHPASRFWMHGVCERQNVPFTATGVWDQLEHDDAFAAVAARLLLFTDPKRLPAVGDVDGAWRLYLRTWRPGAYTNGSPAERAALRAKWGRNYEQAVDSLTTVPT